MTVIGVPCPAASTLNSENGSSVTHTSRKMIVMPAKRMSRAISFGVFCRFAPSTMAIMRSRNVSPGLAVTRTTQPIGKHARAAGHAAAVAAAFADHRRAFAGDGAFIDRGHALR